LSFAPSLLFAATALLHVQRSAQAQSAYRCESGGQTVYSDAPCPPTAAGKGELPAQDSDAQRAASARAASKLERDNEAVDQQLRARAERDARDRAAAAKAAAKAGKPPADAEAEPKSAIAKAAKSAKLRSASKKAPGKKRAGRGGKRAAAH